MSSALIIYWFHFGIFMVKKKKKIEMLVELLVYFWESKGFGSSISYKILT